VLRINDTVSPARGLDIIFPGILLQQHKVSDVLVDVAERCLHSLSTPDELPEDSLSLFLERRLSR
jgi:hypothetical protein